MENRDPVEYFKIYIAMICNSFINEDCNPSVWFPDLPNATANVIIESVSGQYIMEFEKEAERFFAVTGLKGETTSSTATERNTILPLPQTITMYFASRSNGYIMLQDLSGSLHSYPENNIPRHICVNIPGFTLPFRMPAVQTLRNAQQSFLPNSNPQCNVYSFL